MYARRADFAKWQRKWTFINCWHMNPTESAAMWRLYAKSNEAIAIRSSFFRLANVLDAHTYVGCVQYIDFERDWMPEGNAYYPFVHKRLSFAHEMEVRALFTQLPTTNEGFDMNAEARRAANRDPDDALSADILAVLVMCGAEVRESDRTATAQGPDRRSQDRRREDRRHGDRRVAGSTSQAW